MQANVTVQQDLSPTQLAEALANSTPQEFAEFWLRFSQEMEKPINDKKLNEMAKVMIQTTGAARKIIFYKLHKLMQFYEVQEEIG